MNPATIDRVKSLLRLFGSLDKDTQKAIVAELPHVIDATEKLGTKSIDALQKVAEDAVQSIERYLTALTNNRTKRITNRNDREAEVRTVKMVVDGKIVEIKYGFLKETLKTAIECGNSDVAIQILQEHSNAEIKQIEAQQNSKHVSERIAIEGIMKLIDEVLDHAMPYRAYLKRFLDTYFPKKDEKHLINSSEMLVKAFSLKEELGKKFPENAYPRLAPAYSLLSKCVESKDPRLLEFAIMILKDEVQKMENALPS